MRIEHLEECLDLAETLNFTQTAKHFYITQPVLSKHISNLEKELDLQIFLRDQHRVRVTKIGQQFIDGARKTVETYHETIDHVERFRSNMGESLSVGFLLGAVGNLIPATHLRFTEVIPHVELKYFTYEFADLSDALYSNKVDMAIGGVVDDLPEDKFEIQPLFQDTFFAVLPSMHHLAAEDTIRPSDLSGATVILPSRSCSPLLAANMIDYLKPLENNITVQKSIRDINSLPVFLKTGSCIGIAMGHVRHYYSSMGNDLVFVPLSECPMELEIAAVWKRSNPRVHMLREYTCHLKKTISQSGSF